MLSLAQPTFSGLPDTPVKQVDVYSDVDTKLANNLTSKISAFDVSLDSILSGATKMVRGLGDALRNEGLDLNTARERLKDALGGSRGAISDISRSLERAITGDLTGVDDATGYVNRANTMVDSVRLVMGGVDRTFINNDYKSVSAVMGFVRDLSNNQLMNVFDLGAEAALVKGILQEVTAWGIPELIDETLGAKWNDESNSYDYDYDDEFRFSVVKRASDNISPSTSLAVIEQLMEHGGDKALIADNPSFPEQLLAGYVLPSGAQPGGPYPNSTGGQAVPNYYTEARKLIDILNRLKPDWFYVKRQVYVGKVLQERTYWNLQYLPTASDDAKKVLATTTDVSLAILVAPFYRIESGSTMLKTMYEYMVTEQT